MEQGCIVPGSPPRVDAEKRGSFRAVRFDSGMFSGLDASRCAEKRIWRESPSSAILSQWNFTRRIESQGRFDVGVGSASAVRWAAAALPLCSGAGGRSGAVGSDGTAERAERAGGQRIFRHLSTLQALPSGRRGAGAPVLAVSRVER